MARLVARMLLAAVVSAPTAASSVDTLTARSGLKTAVAEAKKWNPEAVLTGVGTSDARPDGSSDHWTYTFQAKSSRTCFRIVVLAVGKVVPTKLGECTLERTVPDDFVDSPIALRAATSAGFKAGEQIMLTLSHKYDENLTPSRPCWSASSREYDFNASKAIMGGWCVDPKSGKFITRTVGQGGRNK